MLLNSATPTDRAAGKAAAHKVLACQGWQLGNQVRQQQSLTSDQDMRDCRWVGVEAALVWNKLDILH